MSGTVDPYNFYAAGGVLTLTEFRLLSSEAQSAFIRAKEKLDNEGRLKLSYFLLNPAEAAKSLIEPSSPAQTPEELDDLVALERCKKLAEQYSGATHD